MPATIKNYMAYRVTVYQHIYYLGSENCISPDFGEIVEQRRTPKLR